MNGFHANGSVMDGESLDSLSEQLDSASLDAAELDSEPATSETTGKYSWNLMTDKPLTGQRFEEEEDFKDGANFNTVVNCEAH